MTTNAMPGRKKRKRRGVVPDPAKMKKLYEKGTSTRAIAQLVGVSYGKAYSILKEAGVVFRSVGGSNRRSVPDVEADE